MLTKPKGPIFGASEDVAPTSPPTTLKYTRRNKIDSKPNESLQKSADIEDGRQTGAFFFILYFFIFAPNDDRQKL